MGVRIVAIAGAIIGWAALVLQLVLLNGTLAEQGFDFPGVVWRFLGFFTILSNIFAALVLTRAALRPGDLRGLNHPRVEAAALVAIILVGIVYSVALRAVWKPEGWNAVVNHALHDVMPVVFVVFWLMRPHVGLKWSDAAWCLVWPFAYAVYALARGAVDGWYAYWFFDPTKLPVPTMLMSFAMLLGLVLVMSLGVVAIDRAVAKRSVARI